MKSAAFIACVAFSSLLLAYAPTTSAAEQVNLHVSGSGSPFPLIFKVGIQNGFYKEEGLEVLPITAQFLRTL